MKNNKKIIVAFIVCVIVGIGVELFFHFQKPTTDTLYVNSTYGFQFEYTKNFVKIIKENTEKTTCETPKGDISCEVITDPSSELFISVVNSKLDKETIWSNKAIMDLYQGHGESKMIIIGGRNSYEYKFTTSVNYKKHGFQIPLNDVSFLSIEENSKEPKMTEANWDVILFTISFNEAVTKNGSTLSETQARIIAEQMCTKEGGALSAGIYVGIAKTWRFDTNLNATKPGCTPVCIVSEITKTAEIKWKCAGVTTTPTSPTENIVGGDHDAHGCVGTAGYSWCETKQKCLRLWEESCDTSNVPVPQQISCPSKTGNEKNTACMALYQPVCAKVQVECIKAPCPPISQTFGNSCEACKNRLVNTYTEGECAKK